MLDVVFGVVVLSGYAHKLVLLLLVLGFYCDIECGVVYSKGDVL